MADTDKNGKHFVGGSYISRARQDKMIENGYFLAHVETSETEQQAYDRLSKDYEIVRIYTAGTAVRGYRDKYAMCKRYK